MRWSKLKTWILCATAILSVGALGISMHSVKEDTELMEVVAESIAASTATVTFNPGKLDSVDGSNRGVFVDYTVADPSDPNGAVVLSNSSGEGMSSEHYGSWKMMISSYDRKVAWENSGSSNRFIPDGSSVLKLFNPRANDINDGLYRFYQNLEIDFLCYGSKFQPISASFNAKGDCPGSLRCGYDPSSAYSTSWSSYSTSYPTNNSAVRQIAIMLNLDFSMRNETNSKYWWYLSDISLTYTTAELQFAAACSAYRNLGFTYDKNDVGEFTAFRNPRLRFKLNLPSDYSAYIDNESVSVRIKFKNGEAYSEMVLEGSTFVSDGSGGYTCTFSLTNIPPEHFKDEISFIPIIEGMDLVEQTGTYRTPKCCVITLGASVKSMVEAYLGSLYSSLTEAQQEAITAFAEYYATYLA